eukprot:8473331-Karenia_brevis.AAC.1
MVPYVVAVHIDADVGTFCAAVPNGLLDDIYSTVAAALRGSLQEVVERKPQFADLRMNAAGPERRGRLQPMNRQSGAAAGLLPCTGGADSVAVCPRHLAAN